MSHSRIIWASSLPTAKASISTHGLWGSYLKSVRKTILGHKHLVAIQFSSVTQSCPTLCDTMDCSMPGFPVHHQLLERPQTHVYWVGDAIQPPHPVVNFSSCLQSFPASGFFPISQFFASGGPSIGVSASASVLLMNTGCSTQSQTATATGPIRKVTWECVLSRSSQALYDPMDYSPSGSSVHGILQARIRELPCPPPGILPTQGLNLHFLHCSWILYRWATREAPRENGHWLYFLIHSNRPQMGEYQSSRW